MDLAQFSPPARSRALIVEDEPCSVLAWKQTCAN